MRHGRGQYQRHVDARYLFRVIRYSFLAACALVVYVVVENPITRNIRSQPVEVIIERDPVEDARRSTRAPVDENDVGTCAGARVELDGRVVRWGSDHVLGTSSECCRACSDNAQCNVWVWCAERDGCGGERTFGECWLKRADHAALAMVAAKDGLGSKWTSGVSLTSQERGAAREDMARVERQREALRRKKGNHRVYLDVSIDDAPPKRIEFILYANTSPLAAENFRRMCSREPSDEYTFVGASFYRILDRFIDQTGSNTARGSAVNPGGAFDDDPAGLRLKHDRPGLLSVANTGANTSTGHFSIVMAPAPHLDGSYVIFGEVTSGIDHAWAINRLASPSGEPSGAAIITAAGVLETF